MSICKVESFYDKIKNYNDVEDIINRTKQEVEYLNDKCGSIASLKRYFSIYRNYLRTNIDEKKEVSDKNLLKVLLKYLKLNDKQQKEYKDGQKKEINNAQEKLRKIFDVGRYIDVSIGLLSSVSVYDRILGISALTGRRVGEVGCTAKLKLLDSKTAIFEGQLKTRGRTNLKPNTIPVLHDCNILIETLKSIRKSKPEFINNPALFNSIGSSKLSSKVKKHYSGLFEGNQKVKDLRAIYAELAYDNYVNNEKTQFVTVSKNKFFANILGHGEDDVITCNSYFDFCLPKKK